MVSNILNIFFSFLFIIFAIRITRKWVCASFGPAYWAFDQYITFHGVIHHELSHALFAFLTGAKVESINLWTPGSKSLGSVEVYLRGGRIRRAMQSFFISIAPVITAIITTTLMYYVLIPKDANVLSMLSSISFWMFFIITAPILYHATLSKEDIRLALNGIWIVILFFVVLGILFPEILSNISLFFIFLRKFTIIFTAIPLSIGLVFRILI